MIWSPSTYTGWPENYFHAWWKVSVWLHSHSKSKKLYDSTRTVRQWSRGFASCKKDTKTNKKHWNLKHAAFLFKYDRGTSTLTFTEDFTGPYSEHRGISSMLYSSMKSNVSNLFTWCQTELKNVIKATNSFSADQMKGRGTSQQASGYQGRYKALGSQWWHSMTLYIKLFSSEPLNFPGNFACSNLRKKLKKKKKTKHKELRGADQNCLTSVFFLTLRVIFLGSQKSMILTSTGSHLSKGSSVCTHA